MKTSNKLLIAFASALIIIPIMGLVYISQVKYKTGSYVIDEVQKVQNFDTPSKNMTSLPIGNFTSVNIADAKGMVLNVHIVKDKKFGIKVPNHVKDRVTISVDANGQLQIAIKDKPTENQGRYYADIFIYAPETKLLNIAKADGIRLAADQDSLNVTVKESGNLSFEYSLKVNQLAVTANNISEVNISGGKINSLNLDLTATNLRTESNSFENLIIKSAGKSDIEIRGSYDDHEKYSINNLVINTLDQANFKLENIKVNNCSGRFSDQTEILNMPAVNLNQMYSAKK